MTITIPRLLRALLSTPHAEGQRVASQILRGAGYRGARYQRGAHYVYGRGTIPLCLVAHTDTVLDAPPRRLFVDKKRTKLWGQDGLGADDRAGVYAITALLRRGFRPYVLFTDLEEVGGLGAREAADCLDAPAVNALVQLDRRGENDAVYYSCAAPDLEEYVTAHGFRTAQGTYTDISTLMPAWGIAGVNLSVGYQREHRPDECLHIPALMRTVQRVASMLANPPAERIAYMERELKYDPWWEKGKGAIGTVPWWQDRVPESLLEDPCRYCGDALVSREERWRGHCDCCEGILMDPDHRSVT